MFEYTTLNLDRDTSESCLQPTTVDSITAPLVAEGGRQEMPELSVLIRATFDRNLDKTY